MKRVRNHKATGEDLIPIDLIKHLTSEFEKQLLGIINKVYDESALPEDFKAVNFVPIIKKYNSQK